MTLQAQPTLQEGFLIRPAVISDAQAVVDLMNACTLNVIGEQDESVEEVQAKWEMPGFNLETDTLLVFAQDGRLIGSADVEDAAKPVTPFIDIYVLPEYERSSIGQYLAEWAENRAMQAIPKAPEGARVAMLAFMYEQDKWYRGLLESVGFKAIRHHWRMEINLTEPPIPVEWPEGITFRRFAEGDDMRAVLHTVREVWKDHWGYVETPFEEHFERWSHIWLNSDEKFDPSLWLLAMDGDKIAGFSLCRPREVDEKMIGWVGTLGVRREYRRNGLGMALLRQSFVTFYERGYTRVGLGVDAGSLTGATRLYQNAGMHIAQQFDGYEKEIRPGVDLTTQTLDE